MNKIIALLLVSLFISSVSSLDIQIEVFSSPIQPKVLIEVTLQELQIVASWRDNSNPEIVEDIRFNGSLQVLESGIVKVNVDFKQFKFVGAMHSLESKITQKSEKLMRDIEREEGRSGKMTIEERDSLVNKIIEIIRQD